MFVNFDGGSFIQGPTDSPQKNISRIITGSVDVQQSFLSDNIKTNMMGCMQNLVAPYNIRLVQTDPGDVPHSEIVVTASTAADLDVPNTPVQAPANCQSTENVAFVFVNSSLTPGQLCELAMFAITANAQADIVDDCRAVNYGGTEDCGIGEILDEQLACTAGGPDLCRCGGTTVNPHQRMSETYGLGCP